MHIKELTNDEFLKFTSNFKISSIYQTPEYAFVMNKQKFDSLFLGLVDDSDNIVCASLFLIEKLGLVKYAYAPRGYIMDYTNYSILQLFTLELKKYFGKKDVIAIKVNPLVIRNIYDFDENVILKNNNYDLIFENFTALSYRHYGYNNNFEGLKPRFEAILDISIPYTELFKNLKKELRTKIRSAEKKGIKIHKGTKEDLKYLYLQTKGKYPRDLKYFEDCYDFYSKRNMVEFFYAKLDTKKFLIESQRLYQEYLDLDEQVNANFINLSSEERQEKLNKKIEIDNLFDKYSKQLVYATNLLKDFPDGIVTASVLIIKNNLEAYMLMDGFDSNYKEFNSKQLLIWKLIERYSKENLKKFNLGGITNPEDKNPKYDGLNEFKLSFNSKAYEYAGDFELVTNNTLYFMYKNSAPIRSILKK